MNKELCLQWKENRKNNPAVNPQTGRKIIPGKAKYKELDRDCAHILRSPPRPTLKSPAQLDKTRKKSPALEDYEVKFSPFDIPDMYPPSPPIGLETNGFIIKFVSAANAMDFAEFITENRYRVTPALIKHWREKDKEAPLNFRVLSLKQREIALKILAAGLRAGAPPPDPRR